MFLLILRVNFNYGNGMSRFSKRLADAQKTNGGVVNSMVGYLFVLYKSDKPRKKVRTVLRCHFGKISVI